MLKNYGASFDELENVSSRSSSNGASSRESVPGSGTGSTRTNPSPRICTAFTLIIRECGPLANRNSPWLISGFSTQTDGSRPQSTEPVLRTEGVEPTTVPESYTSKESPASKASVMVSSTEDAAVKVHGQHRETWNGRRSGTALRLSQPADSPQHRENGSDRIQTHTTYQVLSFRRIAESTNRKRTICQETSSHDAQLESFQSPRPI